MLKHFLSRLTIFSLLFCLACTERDGAQNVKYAGQTPEVKLEPKEGLRSILMSEYIDSVRYVPLETTEQSLLEDIAKIRFKDGRIYILNRNKNYNCQSICVFDMNGRFLNRIKKVGKGPGEYLNIRNFYLDDQGILIHDNWSKVIKRYGFDGEFVEETPFAEKRTTMERMANGYYAIETSGLSNEFDTVKDDYKPSGYRLKVLNPKGELVYQALEDRGIFTGWGKQAPFFKRGDSLYFLPLCRDSLYLVEKDRIKAVMAFNFGKFHKERSENIAKAIPGKQIKGFGDIVRVLMTDTHLVVEYSHNNIVCFALVDKNTLEVIRHADSFSLDGPGFSLRPATVCGNEWVSWIQTFSIAQSLEKDPDGLNTGTIGSQLGAEYLKNLNGEENPILAFYTLKKRKAKEK
ncbi:hypothetical protein FUAX_06690 [Fulvitalea axinellae]|uniref:6-bladed beta-propeller n=1 Tax=Fulvitalea axinellae TaxID=1182444 RepID=A0AAU9CMX8_9BACT|nr:hypothetical protein FUAX_06690 [Fulvitalea axinellae]